MEEKKEVPLSRPCCSGSGERNKTEPASCPDGAQGQPGSCCGSDAGGQTGSCCGSSSAAKGLSNMLRIVIFILVIAGAITVAVMAVTKRRGIQETQAKPERLIRAVMALPEESPLPDCVFIRIAATMDEETQKINEVMLEAIRALDELKIDARIFITTGDQRTTNKWKQAFGLEKLPATLVYVPGCETTVLEGEITQEALLNARAKLCNTKGCGPGGSCP